MESRLLTLLYVNLRQTGLNETVGRVATVGFAELVNNKQHNPRNAAVKECLCTPDMSLLAVMFQSMLSERIHLYLPMLHVI